MSKAEELAEQMFPEPQMENYDDILEYRNDRDWTFIARGAVVKGYKQAEQDLTEKFKMWVAYNGYTAKDAEAVYNDFKQFITEN